jgi:hypothetical protein
VQSHWHQAREHKADVIFARRDSRENTRETLGPTAGESPPAVKDLRHIRNTAETKKFDERDFAASFGFPSDCTKICWVIAFYVEIFAVLSEARRRHC